MTELLLKLPIIDLSSSDTSSTAASIRQACIEHGFFYLVNHGVEDEVLEKVFLESKKLFSLPLEEKMRLDRKENRGYTPLFAEALDPVSAPKGDPKESYYVGRLEDDSAAVKLNQWPSQEKNLSSLGSGKMFLIYMGESMAMNFHLNGCMTIISAAFFLDPKEDCVVECIESCCSESSPPRFPPIRSGDYLKERFRLTYASDAGL
ncbi:hypothetical protein L484_024067 [Morus notabilis]|uniref:Non-haem dioxygenase N-terminal domain-containing protein n=1 Tax=Morus notabilis TaxID=981085 RepID=W9RPZ8_9ROSA|nr:hypothetical protein L484_024067 [Morus notabilis]